MSLVTSPATHRLAISNHRLVTFQDDRVTFRWKDYAHGNQKKMMTLSSQEFLRRFLLHVLPRGFVRTRCNASPFTIRSPNFDSS